MRFFLIFALSVLTACLGLALPVSLHASAGDFAISSMGGDNTIELGATYPAVAYNGTDQEYLIVWEGDNTTDEEYEIWGQRIDAVTGLVLGALFRISTMGTDGNTGYEARNPAVAYNSTNNEYLVIWWGDDNTGVLVDDEVEIFGQRITASTGAEVGTDDFRISDMGPEASTLYGAFYPKVAYDSAENQYLVVWHGDDNTAPLVDDEVEIFGQLLDASNGSEIGTDFRISEMGTNGDTAYDASNPDVAYNSTNGEYLVVWSGDDDSGSLVNDEFEIYGQRLDSDGSALGTDDFRISDMGDDGDIDLTADHPAVAYDSNNNRYLVVWEGDDDTLPLIAGESEIFGQRLDNAGAEAGTNDFRISNAGNNGATTYSATDPSVSFHEDLDEFLVAWMADGALDPVNDEFEIFGQRIDSDGTDLSGDFRLSQMGLSVSASFDAYAPAVTYNANATQFIAAWSADDDTDGEFEIYGKIFYISSTCGDGVLDATEECDDGNNTDGDDCNAICLIETGETTDLITDDDDHTDGYDVDVDTYSVSNPQAVAGTVLSDADDAGDDPVVDDSGDDTGDDSGDATDTSDETGSDPGTGEAGTGDNSRTGGGSSGGCSLVRANDSF